MGLIPAMHSNGPLPPSQIGWIGIEYLIVRMIGLGGLEYSVVRMIVLGGSELNIQ
jgi:hypothetical protein